MMSFWMETLLHPLGRVVLASFGLLGLVGLAEGLRRVGMPTTVTRRLVHGGVGLFVVTTPWFFETPGPVYGLAVLFVGVNAATKAWGWWRGTHGGGPSSWGTVTFPLGLIPALAATWTVNPDRVFILQIAFLILALADPLAAWIGQKRGMHTWIGTASVAGSGTFLGVALLLAGGVLLETTDWAVGRTAVGALMVAVVATAIEAICQRGWDNFFVVLGVILVLVPLHETPNAIASLSLALVGGVGFGGAAYAGRTLDAEGAVGGGLFAASLVGLGGWAWALPGFVFFVLSSALSVVEGNTDSLQEEDGRTLRQVLANGGIAWGLLGLFVVVPSGAEPLRSACYAGFLGALAAAAADTWATEIGVRSTGRPWSLRTFSRVDAGISGAVSLGGTVGAALGAATVAGAAMLPGEAVGLANWTSTLKIVGSGLLGMSVDSVVGATLQARYRAPDTDRLVEEAPLSDARPVLGWKRVDNETVNLLGTTAGALAAVLLV